MFIAHPLLEAAAPVPSARSFHMTHLTSGSLATDYLHGLLPRGSGKEFACQAEDVGLISGSERSPGYKEQASGYQWRRKWEKQDRGGENKVNYGII